MTNNQRFIAELAVLLIIGGAIYAKATPARQDKTTTPEVIRAQQFELVDADGKVLAVLGQLPERGVGWQVKSKTGKGATIFFAADDGGQHLMMVDRDRLTALDVRAAADAWIRMASGKQKKERTFKP